MRRRVEGLELNSRDLLFSRGDDEAQWFNDSIEYFPAP